MAEVKRPRPSSHVYNMRVAALASTCSKDPSSNVGAVIIDPQSKAILSSGFNGFPIGVADLPERYENRELKMRLVVHAEANAIALAARTGTKTEGAHMYVTATPCSECARLIIQAGIKRVYIPQACPFGNPEDMQASFNATYLMFREAGVDLMGLPPVDSQVFVRGTYKDI